MHRVSQITDFKLVESNFGAFNFFVKMSEQKPFLSIRYTLVLIQLLISISTLNADEWKAALTQNELLEKYGQGKIQIRGKIKAIAIN